MLLDDSVADAQSQPGPLPHRFRSVERVEDAMRVFHSWPVVGDFHAQAIPRKRRSNPDFAVSAFLDYCIDGIIHNVEKNLLKLVKVSRSDGKIRLEFPVDAGSFWLHAVFPGGESGIYV